MLNFPSKKLVLVLTNFLLIIITIIKAKSLLFKLISYIKYPIKFKKSQVNIRVFIEKFNKTNVIT